MSKQWQVEIFLQTFKTHWPPQCWVVPRDKNAQALADLGLMPSQRRSLILDLSVLDYSAGPLPDVDVAGQDVWIFGSTIDGKELYIKLTLRKQQDRFFAKCLSFHLAEQPLVFPFRKKKGGKKNE